MAGRVYTDPAKWAAAVRRAEQRAKDKPYLGAIRRGLKPGKDFATQEFRSSPIGRSIFGGRKRAKGIRTQGLIATSVRRKSEAVFEGALRAKGLAGLVDSGGKTLPHAIKAAPGKRLVFQATGRKFFGIGRKRTGLIAVSSVKHPGGRVAKRPFLRRAMERAVPTINSEVSRVRAEIYAQVVG
jgi:hypothetical protein